jgi:hypothetical protein
MNEEGKKRLLVTRRQLLVAGGAAVGAAAVGIGGFYVLGDGFEEHVAGVLGIPTELAKQLTDRARERMDALEFEAGASAFLTATTFPGSEILPARVRKLAVRGLLGPMFSESKDNLAYLGLLPSARLGEPCAGLINQ